MINNLKTLMEEQIKKIEISSTAFKKAEERYKSIGEWIQRPESQLSSFAPEVYTQGSFALGTAIKPLDNRDHYDIDLVCQLKASKNKFSQEQIKNFLGEELKLYTEARSMNNNPEESRRCWTIEYASDNIGFHLDALPSINDLSYDEVKKQYEYTQDKKLFEINITDNERDDYSNISEHWNVSNPKGYIKWFREMQQESYMDEAKRVATMLCARVQDVPNYKIKTPLQKTIQFLKRHRDIYFRDNNDTKPISIIITTLVTLTYNKSDNVADIIGQFLNNFHHYVLTETNNIVIKNPVNDDENFADKWAETPEKKEAFYKWIYQLKKDFERSHLLSEDRLRSHLNSITQKDNESSKYIRDSMPITIDFNVPHKQLLNYPMAKNNKVLQITATYRPKNFFGGFRAKVLHSNQEISKKNRITFKINDREIKGKKKYLWQVVNTGYEAVNKYKCPRGDFYDGKIKRGGRTRDETTAYTGKHWVQCFIIQNDECVATSREFIVNIID